MARQTRTIDTQFDTRDENQEKTIEGYFVVYDRETELTDGIYEKIDRDAFKNQLSADVRALINHDTTMVLGRTKSNTLELKSDNFGLYGKIKINEKDQDAVNIYERVKRGDVSQCSFGFSINSEEYEERADGVLFTIKDVNLYEVSVCTFPAYEDTSVQARSKQVDEMLEKKIDIWKNKMKERLNNVKTNNA